MYPVIEWKDHALVMLDQRRLPGEKKFVVHRDHHDVARSIRDMVIRGAPAIGIAAAYGIALGVSRLEASPDLGRPGFLEKAFRDIVSTITTTRPTAVNLFWAAARIEAVFAQSRNDFPRLCRELLAAAQSLDREDYEVNRAIGRNGRKLLKSGDTVLTHCNAGALATAGYGTALGVVRAAVENGMKVSVIAGETRPYLQGARLTVWELQEDGIPVTLITDSMAGYVMKRKMAQAVIVGADRVAANGDTANKIGTYSLAVLARHHGIPFFVAAPLSTIDPATADGDGIPIEERDGDEVRMFMGRATARPQTAVYNPAFDVTPAALISALITEERILYPPLGKAIAALRGLRRRSTSARPGGGRS
ncbi:MAG: S-methyl-5-thioribose-1-phosphate isomerase [Candidatus Aminicenantes bacterium]|nr:S-methyl-5-thioribose-1-phosphate isomerase [Candidatus Aminicenantes bacterium]